MAALGTYQTTLFAHGEPTVVADAAIQRLPLDDRCWVDIGRGWLAGADELLVLLTEQLDWRGGRRPM